MYFISLIHAVCVFACVCACRYVMKYAFTWQNNDAIVQMNRWIKQNRTVLNVQQDYELEIELWTAR